MWGHRVLRVAASAALLCSSVQASCSNMDYQVVVYRYSGTTCSGSETVAYYQSGGAIRENPNQYKIYTCCDDGATVTVYDSAIENYTDVTDDQCLTGSAGDTGSSGTSTEESLKFECVKNPTAAKVTLEVFGETETECSTTSPPSYRLPVYEGCNEDFPVIMDLSCQGTDVSIMYSSNRVDECKLLEYDDNKEYFVLEPGCNTPDLDAPFFGRFHGPIYLVTSCGTQGLSGGSIAAIIIIFLLLAGAAGFAYWWFKLRPAAAKESSDFTEYNEYSQLDGDTHNDLL